MLFAATCAVGVCTWWTHVTVEKAAIRNESSHSVSVGFTGSEADCLDEIGAHSAGSFTLPRWCRWWFSGHRFAIIRSDSTSVDCNWDRVKRDQPVVVTETGASCTAGEFR